MLERLRIGALAGLLAIAVIGMSGIAPVNAQDASPVAAECVSPGLPPGTPTPMEEDMASPEAMEGMASPVAMASPETAASPEAMEIPEATPLPGGQEADEATAAEIEAALANYVACTNQGYATGDPGLFVALETPNFILINTGSGNPYDRVASELESPFRKFELLGLSDLLTYDDGRLSGDVHVRIDDHWVTTVRFFLAQDGDTWKVDDQVFLPADVSDAETVSVVGIDIVETTDESTGQVTYEFVFPGGSTTFTQTEALVFTIANTGVELHEALMIQVPEGADPLGLLDGSVAFEDIVFYGGIFGIAPGQTQELAFVNLEPGIYTFVCFFPGPDGAPHAANGMIVQIEIVPPAA